MARVRAARARPFSDASARRRTRRRAATNVGHHRPRRPTEGNGPRTLNRRTSRRAQRSSIRGANTPRDGTSGWYARAQVARAGRARRLANARASNARAQKARTEKARTEKARAPNHSRRDERGPRSCTQLRSDKRVSAAPTARPARFERRASKRTVRRTAPRPGLGDHPGREAPGTISTQPLRSDGRATRARSPGWTRTRASSRDGGCAASTPAPADRCRPRTT